MSILESAPILLHELITYGKKKLDVRFLPNYNKEIEWFIETQFLISFYDLKFNKNYRVNKKERALFIKFIDRRLAGEPFQYIINNTSFYGYDFFVNDKTLIPRPETELIINTAKMHKPFNKALDIGTGCGNIAITLSLENIANQVDAIDISWGALSVAIKNAKTHDIKNVCFIKHDIFKKFTSCKYDLIVSNPPYISSNDYARLDHHIKFYEPQKALTDYAEGFSFYQLYAKNLGKILNPHGKIILEIGYEDTKANIDQIFSSEGFKCTWYKDLNNNYRVVEVSF